MVLIIVSYIYLYNILYSLQKKRNQPGDRPLQHQARCPQNDHPFYTGSSGFLKRIHECILLDGTPSAASLFIENGIYMAAVEPVAQQPEHDHG